ncbi:MAG: 4Fe-4S dicluster domain-containing protein [Methanocorpusculum sp.]|uniref:EMC6-like membrane protein n=1 Tax=Methanocorpusculum sp. TaxID=2058474 RepID=UPI002728B7F3|nr:4Fe-4S dicluster domain-containing protein [Methanocorpusculum sp.]MDO9522609.1 4Fe-4S dicluster domain-containing protein [Methanocorpusculum sp.]
MQVAYIKKEKCNTAMCNRCVKFCPASRKDQPVIFIGRNKKATVVEELCNGCGKCVKICPEKAIEMVTRPDRKPLDVEIDEKIDEIEEKTEEVTKQTAPTKRKETPEEKVANKKARHAERVIRTAIACGLGMVAGLVSYYLAGTPNPINTSMIEAGLAGVQANPIVGILVLLVAIVLQKSLFMVIKIDTSKLGKKDWFYQAFLTFATWYLSWTLMLSTSLLSA